MSGSASERAIRDYTAGRLREMLPDARIIHELVVGGCRADLAAIEPERVTLIEIKSEKDTLGRLERQVTHFSRAAHRVVVVAHEKWFDRTPYNTGEPRFAPSDELRDWCAYPAHLWAYPEVVDRPNYARWTLAPYFGDRPEPRAAELLGLLWRSELIDEARRHCIATSSRATVNWLIREMAWLMTGREIAGGVCRQLRQRPFPEADTPIVERQAA